MSLSNLFDHFAHFHFYYAMIMRVKSIVKTPNSTERNNGRKEGREDHFPISDKSFTVVERESIFHTSNYGP